MKEPSVRDRLIVALDVSSYDEAMGFVDRLGDSVTFFKVGWQLFIAGDWKRVVQQLTEKKFFVDLKVPGDIANTIASLVRVCVDELKCVRFLTLSESVRDQTIRDARDARGEAAHPWLIAVPLFSGIGENEFQENARAGADLNEHILSRSHSMLAAGCDGIVVSGPQIAMVREKLPESIIVSPAIRPAGHSGDDHKRFSTATEAIRMGADFLVLGRPIRLDPNPRDAANRFVDEIDKALASRKRHPGRGPGSRGPGFPQGAIAAKTST